MAEIKKLSVEDVIQKLGAGKAHYLLGDIINNELMENFGFDEWRSFYIAACGEKDVDKKKQAFVKLQKRLLLSKNWYLFIPMRVMRKKRINFFQKLFSKVHL